MFISQALIKQPEWSYTAEQTRAVDVPCCSKASVRGLLVVTHLALLAFVAMEVPA